MNEFITIIKPSYADNLYQDYIMISKKIGRYSSTDLKRRYRIENYKSELDLLWKNNIVA